MSFKSFMGNASVVLPAPPRPRRASSHCRGPKSEREAEPQRARRARAGRAHHVGVLSSVAAAGFDVPEVDARDAPPPPPPEPEVRAKVVSKRNNKFGKKGRKFRGTDPYAAPAKEDEFDF